MMRSTGILSICLLVLMPLPTPATTMRGLQLDGLQDEHGQPVTLYNESYALVIGMSDYGSGWPDLPGVRADIQAVRGALSEQGFEVVVRENLDRQRLEQAFMEFITTYGQQPENRLVFYFAGHGHTVTLAYGDDMGYIVPVDAPNPNDDRVGFLSKALDMQMIEVYARRIQSKHALFLFDSCFSGSIFSLSRAAPESITYKTAGPVRQFITSGSAYEQVPDESIFRRQFIAALAGDGDLNGDGYMTGTELGEFLQNTVVNYTKGAQHPQYGKLRHPALDKGDVVFQLSIAAQIEIRATVMPQGDPEVDMWEYVKASDAISDFHDFLAAFPDGRFANVARLRLKQLERQQQATGSAHAGQLLFQDAFNAQMAQARALFGSPYMAFDQTTGQGCVTALQPGLVLPAMYSQPVLADFVLDVDIIPRQVSPNSQYGIIFRSDDEADGLVYYYLLNLQPAAHKLELLVWDRDWGTQAAVSLSPDILAINGVNHLRLEAHESTFGITINGVFVQEIQNFTLPEPGIFGLSLIAASPSETVCFDNLAIYDIP